MLEKIVERTRIEVEQRKKRIPPDLLEADNLERPRSLYKAIKSSKRGIIPEIKPASPTEGDLNNQDVASLASAMEKGGACAISVLTEPFYFHGSLENLRRVKKVATIPVMRKDFIVDEYQLLESRYYQADAVLLMVSVLHEDLPSFYDKARDLGMEALVEVHNESELETALDTGVEIIGINNRNLDDMSIDLGTTKRLAALIPKDKIVVSESGIRKPEDVDFLLRYANAVLLGTLIMRSNNVEEVVRRLSEQKTP